jgi:hypothetical protein
MKASTLQTTLNRIERKLDRLLRESKDKREGCIGFKFEPPEEEKEE